MMLQIKEVDLIELQPWEENPRINDHAVDAVAESITKFGFNVPILCDHNNTIIAGHTRWKAAKKLALLQVPIIQVEMTASQRKAFAIADNKLAEISNWDVEKLGDILFNLKKEDDIDLYSLGFSDDELHDIFARQNRMLEDIYFAPKNKPSWLLASGPADAIAEMEATLQPFLSDNIRIEVCHAD